MARKALSSLLLVALVLVSAFSSAAPRDKAAQKKIEEAIYTDFLNTDFDTAEGLLLGTIRACEDKCSPQLIAKAWMYVGLVRGSGRNNLAGAAQAFATAITTDPNVALDTQIATDPVKQAFAKAKAGGGGGGGGGGEQNGGAEPPPSGGGGAALTCKPSPTEIETRRPVPMQCETDQQLESAKLHYKAFGQQWTTVKMELNEGTWRGTIPCTATQSTGKLHYYVEGLDADNKVVSKLGSKDKPREADIVSETSADPPAYPEEEPPARCGVEDVAPPTSGGAEGGGTCGSWGAPCGTDGCCESGLECNAGVCEGKCESDSDCKDGAKCSDGKCESGEGSAKGPHAKNWIGLHFGLDLASISANNACTADSRKNAHIACFQGSQTYEGTPSNAASGKITGGFAPATMRILASYERLFGPIGAEGRVGFAFNGGQTPQGGSAFLPVHVEVRGKYWLLGEAAFTKPGVRPWLHLGGGLAQIDTTVKLGIIDCKTQACASATSQRAALAAGGQPLSVNATKQLGKSFATLGGGVMYAIAKNHGAVLNIDFIIPFPSSGFVFEPSLGYEYGF